MPSSSTSMTVTPARLIWLQLAFSDRLGTTAADLFRARLKAFLAHSGLAAVTSLGRMALVGTSRPITALDRALVLDWLIAQPEVVLVHIERARGDVTREACPGGRRG